MRIASKITDRKNPAASGRRGLTIGPFLLLSLLILGCAPNKKQASLPTYTWRNEQEALRILNERAARVRTAQSECTLVLTRPDKQSVRLDGAVILAQPGRARLKAWKFNQSVFDLTLNNTGVWVVLPPDPKRREQVATATGGAASLVRQLVWLIGGAFEGEDVQTRRVDSDTLLITKRTDNGQTIRFDIDSATLTTRSCELVDQSGKVRFSLKLQDYKQFGDIIWPMKLVGSGEMGTFEVRLKNPEFNIDPDPRAFVPPRRAEKLP